MMLERESKMEPETVLTVVASIMGGSGITAITNYLNTKMKTSSQVKLEEQSQPVTQLTVLLDTVNKRVDEVEADNKKAQQEHIECLKMHAMTMQELGMLKGQLIEQRESVNHLRSTTSEQAAQMIKAASVVAADGLKQTAIVVKEALDKANVPAETPKSIGMSGIDKEHPLPVEVIPSH